MDAEIMLYLGAGVLAIYFLMYGLKKQPGVTKQYEANEMIYPMHYYNEKRLRRNYEFDTIEE